MTKEKTMPPSKKPSMSLDVSGPIVDKISTTIDSKDPDQVKEFLINAINVYTNIIRLRSENCDFYARLPDKSMKIVTFSKSQSEQKPS